MKLERTSLILLVALIALLLAAQARSLFIFPQPDGARWWGDETGQMLELRAELQTGYAHIPTALGSSLAITNGLVRGNSWLAALIYGVPALAFSKYFDLVTIGRSITFLLSLGLCWVMYRFLRRLNVSPLLSAFGVLVLVSTRSFFFASHAARLDAGAGLSVLLFVSYLATRFEQLKQIKWQATSSWYFVYGVVAMLFSTLSIHLVTLLGLLSLYAFWQFGTWRTPKYLFAVASGAGVVLSMLIGIYALTGAPMSLFSPSVHPNQFQSVAGMLPILRPFSRSVQSANILERISGLWSEAPQFLLLFAVAFVSFVVNRRTIQRQPAVRFVAGSATAIFFAWMFFESPALYYYIQVLPLFILTLILSISRRARSGLGLSIGMVSCSMVITALNVSDVLHADALSLRMCNDNHSSLQAAIRQILTEAGESHPIVLAQNPAIALLEHDTSIRLMTAHVVSFPISRVPLNEQIAATGANYILIYASGDAASYSVDYAALRPIADSLGRIILEQTGTLFDVHCDYFHVQVARPIPDTLILYKLPASLAR